MKRLLIILFWLYPALAFAVPTFDAVSTDVATNSPTVSVTHSIGTCDHSLLLAWVAWYDAVVPITGVAASAGAMSFVGGQTLDNGAYRLELWQITGAASGQVVTATFNGDAVSATIRAISYCEVDQVTPLDTAVSATNVIGGGVPTLTVTSAVGDLVIDGIMTVNLWTVAADASQTERGAPQYQHADYEALATSEETGAASVSMDWAWTNGSAEYWSLIGVSVNPYSAPPAVVRRAPIIFQ